jgi:dethiobiotin synthetase
MTAGRKPPKRRYDRTPAVVLRTRPGAGLFITGTDTGVGKTLVTAGLAAVLRARGIDVGVMKPIETGCSTRRGRLVPSDSPILRDASRSRDPMDLINPYRFREPLAPMVAAERAGQIVELGTVQASFGILARRHQVVLVEGAGGLMVPVTERETVRDLAALLRLPVLVVVGSRLGAISHARLTVDAALHAGLPLVGAILNHATMDRSLAAKTNHSALRRLLPVPLIAEIPHITGTTARAVWRDPRLHRLLDRSLPHLLPHLPDSSRIG